MPNQSHTARCVSGEGRVRAHHLALSASRTFRRRRHGRRLQGRRRACTGSSRSSCSPIASRTIRSRATAFTAKRSGLGIESSRHLHDLRRRRGGRQRVHRDGVSRGLHARPVDCRGGLPHATADRARAARSSTRWTRRTPRHRAPRHQAGEHLRHLARPRRRFSTSASPRSAAPG